LPEPAIIALVMLTFLAGGLVKGTIGLGLPVVVLTLLTPFIGLRDALALFLVPGVASNVWQATHGNALRPLARRLRWFLAAAVAGILAGVQVLAGGDTALLERLLGAMLIVYSVAALTALRLPPPGRHEPWLSPLAGGMGGVMFGMTGIFIVPGILYLQTLGFRRDALVQALGITFVTISGTLAVAMGGAGLVSGAQAALSAVALAPTFLGLWVGRRLRHRISEEGFRRLFFLGLIGAGGFMIWAGGRA